VFEWVVDEMFFDPDSHARLADLEHVAGREGAVVWQGRAASNRVRLAHP
jgi:hypothetical protein